MSWSHSLRDVPGALTGHWMTCQRTSTASLHVFAVDGVPRYRNHSEFIE